MDLSKRLFKSDIVVVTGLAEPELEVFREEFNKMSSAPLEEVEDDPDVYLGWLSGAGKQFLIYAASQPRYGIAGAAALAGRLIERYAPRWIALVGIAAGTPGKVKIGDVLIADAVINYQEGKLGLYGLEKDRFSIGIEGELHSLFKKKKGEVMRWLNGMKGSQNQVHLGPVLSGNQVIASTADIQMLLKDEPRKTIGLEMEGFGIFHAAHFAQHPKPRPLLIKGVSDLGGDEKNDDYQELAASNSALFFLRFTLDHLKPVQGLGDPRARVEALPWSEQGRTRGNVHLAASLAELGEGRTIDMISITGASVLAPELERFQEIGGGQPTVSRALEDALRRGARCRAVLLDPESSEAANRMRFESPAKEGPERLLTRDSARVREVLDQRWRPFDDGRLQVRYSSVGLQFSLWLLSHEARVEPYHFGKLETRRMDPESALCGFSQVWISAQAPEYELLTGHFENLWAVSRPLWPTRSP